MSQILMRYAEMGLKGAFKEDGEDRPGCHGLKPVPGDEKAQRSPQQ